MLRTRLIAGSGPDELHLPTDQMLTVGRGTQHLASIETSLRLERTVLIKQLFYQIVSLLFQWQILWHLRMRFSVSWIHSEWNSVLIQSQEGTTQDKTSLTIGNVSRAVFPWAQLLSWNGWTSQPLMLKGPACQSSRMQGRQTQIPMRVVKTIKAATGHDFAEKFDRIRRD